MSTRFTTLGAALAFATCGLAGCASTAWQSDNRMHTLGDTVRATTASQIIDPSAARNTSAVAGIDGRAARAAQARYEASFAQPGREDRSMTTGSAK